MAVSDADKFEGDVENWCEMKSVNEIHGVTFPQKKGWEGIGVSKPLHLHTGKHETGHEENLDPQNYRFLSMVRKQPFEEKYHDWCSEYVKNVANNSISNEKDIRAAALGQASAVLGKILHGPLHAIVGYEANNYFHGDVKPANLLYYDFGTVNDGENPGKLCATQPVCARGDTLKKILANDNKMASKQVAE